MSEPKRYRCDITSTEVGHMPILIEASEPYWAAEDGEYVSYKDYSALLEKVRKIAAEVIKERKSAEDWHARMSDDYDNPNGSAMGQDVVEASASLQAWEKAEELLKDFAAKEGKPIV